MGHVRREPGIGDLSILLDRRGRPSDCFAVHEPTVENRVDSLHSPGTLPDVSGCDHLGEFTVCPPGREPDTEADLCLRAIHGFIEVNP
jgi:hypothetical protein